MRGIILLKRIIKKLLRYSSVEKVIGHSEFFDKEWYQRTYLQGHKCNPVKHFAETGWKQGYNPSPWFSTSVYLDWYEDVREAQINPLYHYETAGRKEFRNFKCVE